ncbi:ATP-dependent DNA helicase Q1 [Hypsizygus marmoreus]|uniref:DNA 3'-5' helicase n=1 Tax=Hypsizygus marmoreus TaxID=39966 RepID=A0A369JBA0_HYPMA|nr:ATP-dependent DNA helicase Q1 [Hypsizygus marmoreus]
MVFTSSKLGIFIVLGAVLLTLTSSTNAVAITNSTIGPGGNGTTKAAGPLAVSGFAQTCSWWGGTYGNAGGKGIAILQATCRTTSGASKTTSIDLAGCIANDNGILHCRVSGGFTGSCTVSNSLATGNTFLQTTCMTSSGGLSRGGIDVIPHHLQFTRFPHHLWQFMDVSDTQELSQFRSTDGWKLCRQILLGLLPFGPHDYQVDGVAHLLDGIHVLAVSATGSGKTAYIYMLVHILLKILKDPSLCPSAVFPRNPAIIVVCPTTALEENMEMKIRGFGLTAKAVNSITVSEAERAGTQLWRAVEWDISVILISPEMLSTPGFQRLLDVKRFTDRVYALVVDEIHLLNTWGTGFRPEFRQIGFLRARFPTKTVFLGLTATLRKGKHTDAVCKFMGLHEGKYHFIRRSNARPDVQLIFRTLHAHKASERFPELDWVLRVKGKVLIFCASIRFGFRLAVYLWHLDPQSAILHNTIRLFNSLNSDNYNSTTLKLLEGNQASKITIATDKLSVGVDIADFQTVVIIDPRDLDDLWQKGGRVGRDRTKVKDAQMITYLTSARMKAARAMLQDKGLADKGPSSTGSGAEMERGLAEVVLAKCHVAEINRQYDNPLDDPPCSAECTSCSNSPPMQHPLSCNCSGCDPELQVNSVITPKPRQKPLPLNIRVTKEMRQAGKDRLIRFREQIWEDADELTMGFLPAEYFLPDSMIEILLDQFPLLLSKEALSHILAAGETQESTTSAARELLKPFLKDHTHLTAHALALLEVVSELHTRFDGMRLQKRLEANERRGKKATEAAVNPLDSSEESEDDGASSNDAGDGVSGLPSRSTGLKIRIDLRNRRIIN